MRECFILLIKTMSLILLFEMSNLSLFFHSPSQHWIILIFNTWGIRQNSWLAFTRHRNLNIEVISAVSIAWVELFAGDLAVQWSLIHLCFLDILWMSSAYLISNKYLMMNNNGLCCIRYYAKCFPCIISFNLRLKRQTLLSSLFYKRGNWGPESLSILLHF